jgi:menaquinone-dependent protoporphyrinogen oxidase
MKVLVATASKHGATEEIGAALSEVLAERGFEVDNRPIEMVTTVEGYDAAIVGSAVYAGRWMKQARGFVETNAQALAEVPVWLYSSGPIGYPPKPEEDPVDVAGLMEATAAREHRVFAGKIDKGKLNFGERAIVKALRAPEGDFRGWDEIRGWAGEIADALTAAPVV